MRFALMFPEQLPIGVPIDLIVSPTEAAGRLDLFLTAHFPTLSRTVLRRMIQLGSVTVDGRGAKPSYKLNSGQRVQLTLESPPRAGPQAESMPLDILYEDDHLAVINKLSGVVVHPAKGHWSGTLAGGLQHHFNSLSTIGGPTRPGIVHRLDRDTSGVIVIAKNDLAHRRLAEQFAARTVEKEYFAIVVGTPQRDRDLINLSIGNHPYQREKMALRQDPLKSRPASTFYEVLRRFRSFATVRVIPKTGRTHQIRLHLDAIGCPVLCDRLYGGRAKISLSELSGDAQHTCAILQRQALHAAQLSFNHPQSGDRVTFAAPLPEDIKGVLAALEQYRSL